MVLQRLSNGVSASEGKENKSNDNTFELLMVCGAVQAESRRSFSEDLLSTRRIEDSGVNHE